MKIDVEQGQSITVIDIEGGQVVDFFAEVNGNADEFLSTGVTIDCNESLKIECWRYYLYKSIPPHDGSAF